MDYNNDVHDKNWVYQIVSLLYFMTCKQVPSKNV